jgi:hypothetical protein
MFRTFSKLITLGPLAISLAPGQSSQSVQTNIPFGFTVQDMTLSAGNYQLSYNNTAHILWIRGLDQNSPGAFVTARPDKVSISSRRDGDLVFQCYDKICYLADVRAAITGYGDLKVHLPGSERTLALTKHVVNVTIPIK